MKLFDRLFRREPQKTRFAPTFDGYTPIYSQFGTNIYASDVVQQVLKCIVDEIKKLKPVHVRYKGSDTTAVNSDIQKVLDNPNDLMTTSEFLEKVTWLLLMNELFVHFLNHHIFQLYGFLNRFLKLELLKDLLMFALDVDVLHHQHQLLEHLNTY